MINNEIRVALKRVCEKLNNHNVECLLIGGIAVGFYGYQRMSFISPGTPEIIHDIDFWYRPTNENFINLVAALKDLGVNTESLEKVVFDPSKTFLRVPQGSFKIEFLPKISGVDSFTNAFIKAYDTMIDDYCLKVIGYDDLVKNKKATNRDVDRQDIEQLEQRNKKKGGQ